MNADQIKRWRAAHPEIDASDAMLGGMPDCASLYAQDFIVMFEAKTSEAAPFLRSILRELVWAYGNWQKAQRDGNAPLLMADLLNHARGGPEYDFTRRFILDYMRGNNIADISKQGAGTPDFEQMIADFDSTVGGLKVVRDAA